MARCAVGLSIFDVIVGRLACAVKTPTDVPKQEPVSKTELLAFQECVLEPPKLVAG